ncbi:MAG: cell division protein FtsA [Nitrospirota bacterium]
MGFFSKTQDKSGEFIIGLDAGTTKVCVIVGEVKDGGIDIIGIGSAPSRGLKKGVVVNIESTVESIKNAVQEAEMMSGVEIKSVYAGTAGRHIKSISSSGVVAVKDKEIDQSEVERVVNAAGAVAIPFDREILHVIPSSFTVNGQNGISDPCGMEGVRLEADVQIITGDATSVHNLIKSCQKAGIEVIDVFFEPLASASLILSEDEKELGVALIDIGGGTTDITIFQGGCIRHIAALPVGGGNFTNDIAIGMRMQVSEAEDIKKKYGASMLSLVREDEKIEISGGEERTIGSVPRRHLIEILQPRAEELFTLIKEELMESGLHGSLVSGVVLTGGGAAMEGMNIMAQNVLELPVRTGVPSGIINMMGIAYKPEYLTGMGLVYYGAEEILTEQRAGNSGKFGGMMTRLKSWAKGSIRF